MIQQLVRRMVAAGVPAPTAAGQVLAADPVDLAAHLDQVWYTANLTGAPPSALRQATWSGSAFAPYAPTSHPAWDHLGYAFALENTRAVQIFARVVRVMRSGEGLGVASAATQRWLDVTEALVFGAANPVAAWLSTSSVRPDSEAVRRNAYHRLFGMDLAHGTDANAPYPFDKAETANRSFVGLFEELLFELWKAIENVRNIAGANAADDDRIFRLAEQIGFMLRSRRQNALLAREELAAVTALGWVELTLSSNSPVVLDLRADATSSGDRLKGIGARVGLTPHSRAGSFFSMASELSLLLRALEANWITDASVAWLLYMSTPPTSVPMPAVGAPLGTEVRRVITEWAAASGRDLKQRAVPTRVVASNGMQRVGR
jgi:hypothetical protein